MPTYERALRVKAGMERGTGRKYAICWDDEYQCFRVLREDDYRVRYKYVKVGP